MSLQACRKVRRGLNKYGLQIAITVHIIRINLLLLLALLVRGLRVIACVLRMLLGLRRMFLALCMVILAVRISGSAMRLRCRFVMLGRLVVRVFHRVFSLLATECRLLSTWLLTEASTTGQRQWSKKKRRCLYLIAVPPLKVRGHVQTELSSRGIHKASYDRNKDRRLDVEQCSPNKTQRGTFQ
jgi:hypothetical protein